MRHYHSTVREKHIKHYIQTLCLLPDYYLDVTWQNILDFQKDTEAAPNIGNFILKRDFLVLYSDTIEKKYPTP